MVLSILLYSSARVNPSSSAEARRVHPEMVDVEPGEELMGVTFDKKDSCDLVEYKHLQARIEKLKAELEGDDEEEDDDGDIVVRV